MKKAAGMFKKKIFSKFEKSESYNEENNEMRGSLDSDENIPAQNENESDLINPTIFSFLE
jgi:hypothetical protein